MNTILYIKRLAFLEWYAKDNEDLINIGKCVVDSLKKDKIVEFTVEGFFQGMVELGCIPWHIIENNKDLPKDIKYSKYIFKLID